MTSDKTGAGRDVLLGDHVLMREARRLLLRYAASDVPVLIVGESGTGKRLAAWSLHTAGPRRHREPVVAILAGMGETARAELLGYRRGSFTGADRDHDGLLRQAHGSSLILDDVIDAPPHVQALLLRAMEEKRFRPLGASADDVSDIRVVATANRCLDGEVRAGRFRLDLYHRLRGAVVRLPALREHVQDIPLYAEIFLGRAAEPKRLTQDALSLLARHPWPGNVRELDHVLQDAALRTDDPVIGAAEIQSCLAPASPGVQAEPRKTPDPETVLHALSMTRGNKREAARRLRISRDTLYRILRRQEIDAPSCPQD